MSRKRRTPTPTDRRANSGIAPVTGNDCSHDKCARTRTYMTQAVMHIGRQAGMTDQQCRRTLRGLPGLLCQYSKTWPPAGMSPREISLLQACFATAMYELGVTGLLGQEMAWYPATYKLAVERIKAYDARKEVEDK